MIRELAKSIREYKKVSIMTPILVSMEVVMECLIPFIIANLVNQIKAGCEFQVIAVYGLVLVLMAGISLLFGAWAGKYLLYGLLRAGQNLRKDMFYNIQNFSFENIDKFSASSLVTMADLPTLPMCRCLYDDYPHRHPLPADADFRLYYGLCHGR